MTLQEIMTSQVVDIAAEESVQVAARTMSRRNIGLLPVLGRDGKVRGVLTDRDIVTRCLAQGRSPEKTQVGQIMTRRIVTADTAMDTVQAAQLMAREQIRRLPVVEEGKLKGLVSLADLARTESAQTTGTALAKISEGISER